MRASELASLVIRLFAVYCFIQAVPYLRDFGVFIQLLLDVSTKTEDVGISKFGAVLVTLFPTFALIAIGICLLRFSRPLGNQLTRGASDQIATARWSTEDVQSIAFAVAGALIVAWAIPPLFRSTAQLLYLIREEMPSDFAVRTFRDTCVAILAGGVQLTIGLGLFFGSRGLSALWHRLRSPGHSASPEADV